MERRPSRATVNGCETGVWSSRRRTSTVPDVSPPPCPSPASSSFSINHRLHVLSSMRALGPGGRPGSAPVQNREKTVDFRSGFGQLFGNLDGEFPGAHSLQETRVHHQRVPKPCFHNLNVVPIVVDWRGFQNNHRLVQHFLVHLEQRRSRIVHVP